MTSIMLTIPLELTVSQIARANPAIGNDEACELAQELHSIIAAVQAAYAARPPDKAKLVARLPGAVRRLPYEVAVAYELGDVLDSVRNTVFGHWPADPIEECELSCCLAGWLDDLEDGDNLYARYLRLSDRVQGTNFATDATVEEGGAALH